MADRDVDLNLNARDNASDVVGDVADAVERLPEDATVDVDADTRDAARSIESFDRQVEDLTEDGRELRIRFRAEQLQREIRNALRDLERLDDPVEIEARTTDLERAQSELRDLSDLADRKYEIEIDADPKRTARRASDDLDGIRQKGEGLQSAIPAIRGFGDELGGAAQGAGIASQAVADLGDFSLIAGERFAATGSRMSGVATKIGTALGAAGLAGAIGGIAIQLGSTLLPKMQEWIGTSEDARLTQEELETATRGAAAALAEGNYIAAVEQILSANSDMVDSAAEFGISQTELARFLTGADSRLFTHGQAIDRTDEGYRKLYNDARDVRSALSGATGDLNDQAVAAVKVGSELFAVSDAGKAAASGATEQGEASADAVDDTFDHADATAALAAAADAAADAITGQVTAQRSAADAQFALNDANREYAEGLTTAQEVLEDQDSTLYDMREVMDDVAESAADVADAEVRIAQETAAATGETVTQVQKQDLWNQSMLNSAATATGPLRQSIVEYIAQVNGIPEEEVTDILAAIDNGSITEAEGLLKVTSRTRTANMEADALTAAAEGDLNNTARDRTARINAQVRITDDFAYLPSGGRIPIRSMPGGPDLGSPLPGTPRTGGRSGQYSTSNDLTVAVPTTAAGSGVTNNVTVNLPTGADARDVVRAVNRWTRINGRP